ncbi:MAG: ankyrin repeat domain-containing protein [Spirochaetaceae bacterium]
MKFKIILVLLTLMLSCQTNKIIDSVERTDVDFLEIISKNKIDRQLEDWQEEKLNTLLTFGYSASDILSYSNRNLFATLELKNNKEDSLSAAERVLHSIWDIYTKDEYMKQLNTLLLEGMRERYIDILNLILTKKHLLNDLDQLRQYETWETEIKTGIITQNDYTKMVFILNNRDFISYRDVYLFELERISIFTRWGFAMDYLSRDQANYIIEDVALEMSKFDISWLDWGSSYIAGLTMLWYNSEKISNGIRNRALTVQLLVNRRIWSKSDLKDLPDIANDLMFFDVSKDPEIFKLTIQPPKLPTNIDIAPEVAMLFDYERKSKNLTTFYIDDYELQTAIGDKRFNKVESILTQRIDKIHDIQLSSGLSYVSYAVTKKDKKTVKLLLDSGFNPNLPNTGGNKTTSLYYAVIHKENDIVKMLLEAGADPNKKLKNGTTPLTRAILNHDPKSVELLLSYGADPDLGDISGYKPLAYSLRYSLDDISMLLIPEVKNINSIGKKDWSNLHIAARYSTLEIIEKLMKFWADPNKKLDDKQTPIYLVTSRDDDNHLEIYNLLISYGTNLDNRTSDGITPLLSYLRKTHNKTYQSLSEKYEEVKNFAPYFRLLFDNTKDKYHTSIKDVKTPLYYLRYYGSKEDINYYLDNTPDQLLSGVNAYTILNTLMRRDLKDEFIRVVNRVNSLDFKTTSGWSILEMAYTIPEYRWAVKPILDSGADINLIGYNDKTIISNLLSYGKYKLIEEAIPYGINIEQIQEIFAHLISDNREDAKSLLKVLRSRGFEMYQNKYFSQKGDYFSFLEDSRLILETLSNSVKVTNTSDGGASIDSSSSFPVNNDFKFSFDLLDFDKGFFVYFRENKTNINFGFDLKNDSLGLSKLVNNRYTLTKTNVDFKFLNGASYHIEVAREGDLVELKINDVIISSILVDYKLSNTPRFVFEPNSITHITNFTFE